MIAAWILYCALWALWLSAVAWVTERALLGTRGPVRMVWLSAMVLSVLGPIVGFALSRREQPVPAPVTASVVSSSTANSQIMIRRPMPTRRAGIDETIRVAAARIDRPLAAVWIATVVGLLVYIGGGMLRLRIVRRRWRRDVVGGTEVMVSEDTGPALVGVFDTTIVIPAWALELDSDALALMLRHELEHRAAGDTRTLAVAQALLVLMPWNPMMWWQLRRLRLAIELDCDARVLRRTSDVATYGRLLLEFGRSARDLEVAGAALADHHASQLEVRIRRMTRRLPARRGRAIALSVAAAAAAIAIGCQLPTPPSPAPSEAVRPTRVDSAIVVKDTVRALMRRLDSADARDRELFASMNRELERRNAEVPPTLREAEMRGEVRTPPTLPEPLVQRLFDAQVRVNEARDSMTRKLREAERDTLERLLELVPNRLAEWQAPRSHVDRLRDSLSSELAMRRRFMTDQHPEVKAILAQLESLGQFLPDSTAALEQSPGCTAAPGGSIIKLIVSNEAALRGGSIVVRSEIARGRGAVVGLDGGMMCSGPGELRLYGRGAFDGTPVVVQSSLSTSIVVVTGSGRVLVAPTPLENAVRRYELNWSPR